MQDLESDNNSLYFGISIAIFATYILTATYVLVKLKLKLDGASIKNIAAFSLSFSIKLTNWIVNVSVPDINLHYLPWIDILTTQIIVVNMYFFAFEMMYVYITIDSQSSIEYAERRKYALAKKLFSVMAQIILFGACMTIYFLRYVQGKEETSYTSPRTIILICARVPLLFIDAYVCYVFCRFFIYFSTLKVLRIVKQRGSLGFFHIIIIFWTITLFTLYALTLILKCVFAPVSLQQKFDGADFQFAYQIYRYLFLPLVDYLIGMSMLYLFYCQGKLSRHINDTRASGAVISNNPMNVLTRSGNNQSNEFQLIEDSNIQTTESPPNKLSQSPKNNKKNKHQTKQTLDSREREALKYDLTVAESYDYESEDDEEYEDYVTIQEKSTMQFRRFLLSDSDYRKFSKAQQQIQKQRQLAKSAVEQSPFTD